MTTITPDVLDKEAKRDRQDRQITPVARRAELVAGYRASGLTMEQYARREGINRLTLAKRVCRQGQRDETKPVKFAEVKLPVPAMPRWAFELTLPNGRVVGAG